MSSFMDVPCIECLHPIEVFARFDPSDPSCGYVGGWSLEGDTPTACPACGTAVDDDDVVGTLEAMSSEARDEARIARYEDARAFRD